MWDEGLIGIITLSVSDEFIELNKDLGIALMVSMVFESLLKDM